MAGTTTEVPMTVNDLINKLKLLPGDWKMQIENSDGRFFIQDLLITEECEVELVLLEVPEE